MNITTVGMIWLNPCFRCMELMNEANALFKSGCDASKF